MAVAQIPPSPSKPSPSRPTRRRLLAVAGLGTALVAAGGCDFFSTGAAGKDKGTGGTGKGGGDEHEAPMLARRVAAGELPPLKERLPDKPKVQKTLTEPGRYGGSLRGVALGPDTSNDLQTSLLPGLFRFSDDLVDRTPHVIESFELSDDYRTCLMHFRRGMKWSDGHPFTADDMLFYYEDWQFDTDVSPVLSPNWIQGGKPMKVTKDDDYTIRFEFAVPYPGFAPLHDSGTSRVTYAPKHFLSKFHKRYNPNAEEEAKANGYQNWQDQFLHYAASNWGEQDPKRPVLAAWMPVENSKQRQRYERNPYFWVVDQDGRQLPYVDELIVDYINDPEVLTLRAASGDLSVAALSLLPANYPVLKRSEQQGHYAAMAMKSCRGADVAIAFNTEHKDPVLKKIFNDVRFRQAVSVAIDREQINKLVFLGQGVPRQATVNQEASFFKKEWGEHYAQYDVDLANRLLDQVGLDRRNDAGVRLRPDGKPMRFRLEYANLEGPKGAVVELVAEQWKKVGLDVKSASREKNYLVTRLQAGQQDASAWHVERQLERAAYNSRAYLRPGGDSVITYAASWRAWLDSGGKEGTEPPAEAKELDAAFNEWPQYEMGTPEYREHGQKIYDLVAKALWVVGTVGESISPVTVMTDVHNVFPESVLSGGEKYWWGGDNWIWLPFLSEQWFLT